MIKGALPIMQNEVPNNVTKLNEIVNENIKVDNNVEVNRIHEVLLY